MPNKVYGLETLLGIMQHLLRLGIVFIDKFKPLTNWVHHPFLSQKQFALDHKDLKHNPSLMAI